MNQWAEEHDLNRRIVRSDTVISARLTLNNFILSNRSVALVPPLQFVVCSERAIYDLCIVPSYYPII